MAAAWRWKGSKWTDGGSTGRHPSTGGFELAGGPERGSADAGPGRRLRALGALVPVWLPSPAPACLLKTTPEITVLDGFVLDFP